MIKIGSLEWIATCSISSIVRLNAALRESIPDLRKLRPSSRSLSKR